MSSYRTSCISASLNAFSPAFDAQYAAPLANGFFPARLLMLTMNPPPRRRRCGSAAWHALNTPVRFVSITSAHCSSVIDATSVNTPTPALLITKSRPPNRATVASTARRTSSCRRTSACIVSTEPGPAASIVGRADDRCAALRPVMATCTPSATSARAIARPMPRDPPVTNATFPRRDCIAITIIHPMREVAIVGAGELGGAVAHVLARRDVVRSLVLVDESGRVAAGKALDISQAAPVEGFATQLAGTTDIATVGGAAVGIVAERFAGGPWSTEDGLLLLKRLTQTAPRATILCAGASYRELVERGVRELRIDRRRLFGSAPEALAAAARALVALAANGSPREVALSVLGVPPSHTGIPWEDATIGRFPLHPPMDETTRRRL